MPLSDEVVPLVLAAGRASRFGSPKALAHLEDRPLLAHVLDAVAEAGLRQPVVVVGEAGPAIREALGEGAATWVVNPRPEDGLASSLRIGLAAAASARPGATAALLLLGDQPRVEPSVIRAVLAAAVGGSSATDRSIAAVAPHYADGGGPNPVLLDRSAWHLADRASGDRGLGPILAAESDRVRWIDVPGANPDVDTPADLERLGSERTRMPDDGRAAALEAAWAATIEADHAQIDRLREVPDGADFYAAVPRLFVVDPRRTDDATLAALLELTRPEETWLDVGAGAGRYALPIALGVHEVIAVEPSPAMAAGLRAGMVEHGVPNIRTVEATWPPDDVEPFVADVGLLAHVAYDIEAIGPFLDAFEAACRRLCVAVLMDRTPASLVRPFWPPVHGEERVVLPALAAFVELLEARGREPLVRRIEQGRRTWESRDQLVTFVRRQLWVDPDGPKDRLAMALLDEWLVRVDGGVALRDAAPLESGLVTWAPAS